MVGSFVDADVVEVPVQPSSANVMTPSGPVAPIAGAYDLVAASAPRPSAVRRRDDQTRNVGDPEHARGLAQFIGLNEAQLVLANRSMAD